MRFESPVTQGFRHVVEDVELPSGTMDAGTNAVVWWAAANVDPETFENPMEVNIERVSNSHTGFASGWHRCLGSHLARMELRAALDEWHKRIPNYRIPEGIELLYSINPRAPHNLPWNSDRRPLSRRSGSRPATTTRSHAWDDHAIGERNEPLPGSVDLRVEVLR